MNPTDTWVLVTGGARRIGRAIALRLAECGANIVVHCNRSRQEAETTAGQIKELERQAIVVATDQSDWSAVEDCCRTVWDRTGGIDVLVNNASVYRRTPLACLNETDWDEMLDTNLKGPFAFARFLGPRMKERGAGKIINLADIGAKQVWPGYIPYCTAKAGLVAATRGLAKALAPEVQVNAIGPGAILWPEGIDDEQKQRVLAQVPLGRTGSPEDIARAVCFLVENDYITGVFLPIDGGKMIR